MDTFIGRKTIDQLFELTFYGLGIIQTGRPYLSRKIKTLQRFEQNNAMMERTNHTVKLEKPMKAFSGRYWIPFRERDISLVDPWTVKPRIIISLVGTRTPSAFPPGKANSNPKITAVADPMLHPVTHGYDESGKMK